MIKKYTAIVILCLGVFLTACGEKPLQKVKVSPVDQKEMVLIPAGEFIMGTNKTDPENTHQKIGTVKPLYLDQHPERKVTLDAYYIDRTEVTNAEYKRFIEAMQFPDLPSNWKNETYPEGMADHPVIGITWHEALTYALWAGKRLPTEAQWEKAARGTEGFEYPWGNEYVKGHANVGIEDAKGTLPVRSKPQDVSPYGVYDMAGNVMEWTMDWYLPYPGNTHKDQRFGKTLKVLRGNAFQKAGHYFLDAYRYAFNRTEVPPDEFFENVGFRCVMPVPSPK